jgi:hypothetical protein
VLRVASNFTLTLAAGTKLTCAEAAVRLLKDKRRWEIRSAGKGSKGDAGAPGPGSPPAARGTTCWSAAT